MKPQTGHLVVSAVAAAWILLGSGVMAAPISYDEAVSGDLATSPVVTGALQLDIGSNTISGTTGSGQLVAGIVTADFDSFFFKLADGTHLQSASIAFSLRNNGAGLPDADYAIVTSDLATVLGMSHVDFRATSPQDLFTALLPLNSSIYLWGNDALGCVCVPGTSWEASYTLTLDVRSNIPEPAAFAFAASGLAVLVAMRKRNRG